MYVPGVLNKYCTDVPDVLIALVKTSTKETLELFNCVLLYIVLVPSWKKHPTLSTLQEFASKVVDIVIKASNIQMKLVISYTVYKMLEQCFIAFFKRIQKRNTRRRI